MAQIRALQVPAVRDVQIYQSRGLLEKVQASLTDWSLPQVEPDQVVHGYRAQKSLKAVPACVKYIISAIRPWNLHRKHILWKILCDQANPYDCPRMGQSPVVGLGHLGLDCLTSVTFLNMCPLSNWIVDKFLTIVNCVKLLHNRKV